MKPGLCLAPLSLVLVSLCASVAPAQVPDTYQNLQVLPEDMGKQELVGVMRSFSDALGVKCNFCHLERTPGDRSTTDWASDELEHKQVARRMMQMTAKLNADLLPAATGEHDFQIQCVTCHRGVVHPFTLDVVLLQTLEKDGTEAAVSRYRELHGRYEGTGSYDFSPASLGKVVETLAEKQGDLIRARTFADLNIEMHPEAASVHVMLAQLLVAAGDSDGAKASVTRALELDPQDHTARRLQEQLGMGK